MAVDENERIARRLFDEVMTEGNLGVLSEIVESGNLTGALEAISGMRTAFPDARVTVDEMVSDGDAVAALLTVEGTHQGPWRDIPPTGRPVKYHFCYFLNVKNGRLGEPSGVNDGLAIWHQLRPSRRQYYLQWWAAITAAAGAGIVIGRALGAMT